LLPVVTASEEIMKAKLALLIAMLALTNTLASLQAQPASKSRFFSSRESQGLIWPRVQTTTSKTFDSRTAALQYLLRNQSFYRGKIDGLFGAQTVSRVRTFQRAKGLYTDGVVGPQTWPELLIRLKRGDRGDAVRALQVLLRNEINHDGEIMYPDLKVDGLFGAHTEEVLRDYQKSASGYMEIGTLKADGIAGARTWCVLLGGQFKD
jgi:peptidoglycan hydrolase-like protein with peptidoglycan-binding domain